MVKGLFHENKMLNFFRSDRKFRARGFNCTVTCEEFDFSDLFSRFIFFVRYVVKWWLNFRIPLPEDEFEIPLEYEDDDEEAEEEYEDYED